MKHFLEHFGPWALVTGASSGIGEAFARRLAEYGMNLVLVARREHRLRRLAGDLQSQHPISARVVPTDLSQDNFLLVNNAGIATTGKFLDNDLGSERALVHINNRAPLILAHHFGRSMRKRRRGGMIFVSSTIAFAGAPGWSNYAASKGYDLLLAEGLAKELHKDGISVLALCPGATQSELWPPGSRRSLVMRPKAVVDIALKKLGSQTTVVPGWLNSLIALSTRLLPRSWNTTIFGWVIGRMLRGVKPASQVRTG
jgi:short-subunit dehydrogenase